MDKDKEILDQIGQIEKIIKEFKRLRAVEAAAKKIYDKKAIEDRKLWRPLRLLAGWPRKEGIPEGTIICDRCNGDQAEPLPPNKECSYPDCKKCKGKGYVFATNPKCPEMP